jgi:hypothetical protein
VEKHLAGHGLHIGVGELHGDAEAVLQPLELRGAGEGRLAGSDEEDAAVQLRLDRLG